MSLIKSISGIRGTIGGEIGEGLTPIDVVHMTAAYGQYITAACPAPITVIGRDARPSGVMISQLVAATLQSIGIRVIDLGLSTTPSVALAVPQLSAQGGIVITASHNPGEWNALKLLNKDGEYIDAAAAADIFSLAAAGKPAFVTANQIGSYLLREDGYIAQHIQDILSLPLVQRQAIQGRQFKVVVDAVNSTGGIAVPLLLQALGVACTPVFCEVTGIFPHPPEPTTAHLGVLQATLQQGSYDLGIAVDPDVDRLVIFDEHGEPWGEEYTLVGVADYVLQHTPGNTVSNLSSSSALAHITQAYGGIYTASPVGEMHVVSQMKATDAVIGGEGNGGIIYPPLHYGRDALVGIALLLSHLATSGKTASQLRSGYPNTVMCKKKLQLPSDIDAGAVIDFVTASYHHVPIHTAEGLRVTLGGGWFHLRASNTEPIMRLCVEGDTQQQADEIASALLRKVMGGFPAINIES